MLLLLLDDGLQAEGELLEVLVAVAQDLVQLHLGSPLTWVRKVKIASAFLWCKLMRCQRGYLRKGCRRH